MLGGTFSALAAEGDAAAAKTTLYYGGGTVVVEDDPTGGDYGNVFSINGFDTYRASDVVKGNNPYIEIPNEYLYDATGTGSDAVYTLKNEFSISFDAYIKSTGFRYAFYTGSDGAGGKDAYGLYLIPDTGSRNYLEGVNLTEYPMTVDSAKYTPLRRAWHNIEISRKDKTYTVMLDGEEWITTESDFDYVSTRTPYIRIGYTPYTADGGANAYIDNIVIKNGEETVYNDTADGEYNIITEGVPEIREVEVHSNVSNGSETAKLIEASYSNPPRRAEALDRGLVAVDGGGYALVSWRWLGTESKDTKYNLYKNGELLTMLDTTNYVDYTAKAGDKYSVAPVVDRVEGEKCVEHVYNGKSYLEVPIEKPKGGTVKLAYNNTTEDYEYTANDASVGDVDGDGQYEIILKWEPTNCRDASHWGATGNTLIDAYKMDGTRLWRVDLGVNVRSGPHDTPFLVADFNNDGKAEVAVRTADGAVAGDGTMIGEDKDWRDDLGKNLTGPLYVTVFDGETGAVIDSADYAPASIGAYGDKKWTIEEWGDDWGNRSERYLAGIGSFDGENMSMLFARGYYDRTTMCAWILNEDNKLEQQWLYDTYMYDDEETKMYRGRGNHSLSIADIDYDGKDEIIYGSMNVDHDGTNMYSTGMGHGDAQHVTDLIPSRPGYEVFSVHEHGEYAFDMRDARTGEILWSLDFGPIDVGRGASADIDPYYPGAESWSSETKLVTADGKVVSEQYSMPANFIVWWDGDLGREVQDSVNIYKWNHFTNKVDTIFVADGCHSINSSKSNPSLTADILGDWREEVIYPTADDSALRIYISPEPTTYKIPTLMHDMRYRLQVAEQNDCYNQPTHVSYYLGYDTETIPVPQIYTIDADGNKVTNPDLDKRSWNIDELSTGDEIDMAVSVNKALVNGKPVYIDSANPDVAAYVDTNDRTMVPVRFISEAFGANVEWDGNARVVTVNQPGTEIKLTIDSNEYTVNSVAKTMDTTAVINNDRTFVPLRAIGEALGYNVNWNNGAIVISEKTLPLTDDYKDTIYETLESVNIPVDAAAEHVTGQPFVAGQANVVSAKITGNNGDHGIAQATDNNFDTYMETTGRQIIQLELDGYYAISAVDIAFADDKPHNFRVYTKWDLDKYDEDLNNLDGWGEAVSTTRFGLTTDPELYIFPVPKFGKYVKIVFDDKHTGDTVQVSELAAIIVR